jgi:TonB family protein
VSPDSRTILTLVLVVATSWGCASAAGQRVGECRSQLLRDERSLNEAGDSVAMSRGVEGLWHDGAGLTLATLVYDSSGAFDTARIVTESFDDAAAHSEAEADERVHMVLGDEVGPGVRRVPRLRGCAPEMLNREAITERLVEESRRLRRRYQLVVKLQVQVADDGRVTEVRIDEGSGDAEVDRAAVWVARSMRFRPTIIEGIPVGGDWAAFPVTFAPVRQ